MGSVWRSTEKGSLRRNKFSCNIKLHNSNCTFQHSKLQALSIHAPSGFIYIINSQILYNANNDTNTCGLVARTGFIHCATKSYIATGGIYMKEAINGAVVTIHIKDCIFNYNGK